MAHHRKAVWQLEAGYTCAVDTDARARGALQRGGVHIRTFEGIYRLPAITIPNRPDLVVTAG